SPEQGSLIRAARLMAQGTRAVMLGWTDLMDEQVAEPARQRLLRGELERFPDEGASLAARRDQRRSRDRAGPRRLRADGERGVADRRRGGARRGAPARRPARGGRR